MANQFPSLSMRIALFAYTILMALLLPVLLIYIYLRARRDPRYGKHLWERFGHYPVGQKNCVWVHAVSLGELRAAAPLIRELINRGESVVTTHFTPAGREAALTIFADDCSSGKLIPVYVPFEFDWVFRRFFKVFSPKYGLVMEVEMWPRMIASAHRHKVPLFMCNGHYPEKSFLRDKRNFGLRGQLVTGFTGLLIKSVPDADRFKSLGASNVVVTGELRFDQEIPAPLIAAADALEYAQNEAYSRRLVVAFTSVVEGEDKAYLQAIYGVIKHHKSNNLPPPLFVYVPRAPERFAEVGEMLKEAGLAVVKRSDMLDGSLQPLANTSLENIDILLGDSLGEMYFYLALAEVAIVGGGFIATGAHNIIEPLALKKTVLVGPNIWTIEFPAFEAIEEGALISVQTIPDLISEIVNYGDPEEMAKKEVAAKRFYASHTGAVSRTLTAISSLLK